MKKRWADKPLRYYRLVGPFVPIFGNPGVAYQGRLLPPNGRPIIEHERLTYRYAGRDFRLTDVYGNVVKEVLA